MASGCYARRRYAMGWRANVCKIYSAFYLILIFFWRVTVQLHSSSSHGPTAHASGLQGSELLGGINHAQFASFTWHDFLTIAPWMETRITKCIYGQGLGIH